MQQDWWIALKGIFPRLHTMTTKDQRLLSVKPFSRTVEFGDKIIRIIMKPKYPAGNAIKVAVVTDYVLLSEGIAVTLTPGQVGSAHLTHGIPNSAPLGTYTSYGNVGPYPVVWDSDSFTFTVTSTASPGTRQKWELLENGLTK